MMFGYFPSYVREAQDRQENEASELEKLQMTIQRLEEDKKLMADEIYKLKEMLKREVDEADREKKTNMDTINEFKLIRQRLDVQLNVAKQELDSLKDKVSNCPDCSKFAGGLGDSCRSGSGDQPTGEDRIRELELELAQTKLAHVEAECRNQNLTHQLRSAEHELNTTKNTWQQRMSKALSSIKEPKPRKIYNTDSLIFK